jgi:hypothetical protein
VTDYFDASAGFGGFEEIRRLQRDAIAGAEPRERLVEEKKEANNA